MSMTMLTTVVVVVVTVGVVGVRAAFDEPDWGFQSYLDENYALTCNHSRLIVNPYNYVEWELPNGDRLTQGTAKHVLSNGYMVANLHLTIQDVKDSDSGVYVCYVYRDYLKTAKRGQLLRGLNMGGPKYREPFDEYRTNLMVGGLAAVVLFVPLVTACFVYKFRFQTKDQKAAKHAARLEATRHQRHLENNGKGAELSEISVTDGKGESNRAYTSSEDDVVGTRL